MSSDKPKTPHEYAVAMWKIRPEFFEEMIERAMRQAWFESREAHRPEVCGSSRVRCPYKERYLPEDAHFRSPHHSQQ